MLFLNTYWHWLTYKQGLDKHFGLLCRLKLCKPEEFGILNCTNIGISHVPILLCIVSDHESVKIYLSAGHVGCDGIRA